jgi:hypothetical protein
MTARGRAISAALAYAKSVGQPVGRPPVSKLIEDRVRALHREGKTHRAIAKQTGIGVATVHRILTREPPPPPPPRVRVRTRSAPAVPPPPKFRHRSRPIAPTAAADRKG